MASGPRIVAELGRPETADETATRKAESSRVYRSSQTTRNLVAALVVTLALVAVIVAIVPRGSFAPAQKVDVAAVARQLDATQGEKVVVPTVPSSWTVNQAQVQDDAWTIVYAPPSDSQYIRVAQAFDSDRSWAVQTLNGIGSQGTMTIDGVRWDRYPVSDPAAAGNVSYALGTQAGRDYVLVYGSMSAKNASLVAASLTSQIRALQSPGD
jgi:photosystem II stability/assembly factor-like uncharacterized protein